MTTAPPSFSTTSTPPASRSSTTRSQPATVRSRSTRTALSPTRVTQRPSKLLRLPHSLLQTSATTSRTTSVAPSSQARSTSTSSSLARCPTTIMCLSPSEMAIPSSTFFPSTSTATSSQVPSAPSASTHHMHGTPDWHQPNSLPSRIGSPWPQLRTLVSTSPSMASVSITMDRPM